MTGGTIPRETVEDCKNFLDFTRCERPNGTAYGTAGKCRKGVEAERDPEENKRLVKEALSASIGEFNSKFYPMIESIINKNADDFLEKTENTPRAKLNERDNVKITAARRLEISIEDYHLLKGENPKVAAQIKGTKEFFDDMKWRLSNSQVLISEGTLRAIWNGKDVSKKAKDLFPEEAKQAKFGQSKGSIGEHAFPTAVLKDKLLSERFKSPQELASYVMRKNFLTWVAGPEDAKMTAVGYRSKTPDSSDLFARYKAAEFKALPIKPQNGMMSADGQGMNVPKWLKNAEAARKKGDSFEDWVSTIVQF